MANLFGLHRATKVIKPRARVRRRNQQFTSFFQQRLSFACQDEFLLSGPKGKFDVAHPCWQVKPFGRISAADGDLSGLRQECRNKNIVLQVGHSTRLRHATHTTNRNFSILSLGMRSVKVKELVLADSWRLPHLEPIDVVAAGIQISHVGWHVLVWQLFWPRIGFAGGNWGYIAWAIKTLPRDVHACAVTALDWLNSDPEPAAPK